MDLVFKIGTKDLLWEDVLKLLDNISVLEKSEKTNRACEKVKNAFSNSYLVLSAWIDNEMVGICRSLSDGVRQSVIYDLNVIEKYRNQGIGRELIAKMVKSLPNGPIILYAVPGKEQYYQNRGFKKLLTGMALFPDEDKRISQGFIEKEI